LPPGVDFTNVFLLFFLDKQDELFWRMVFGEQSNNLANFTIYIGQILLAHNVGEIERQIFR
jgi:hypothetical protein